MIVSVCGVNAQQKLAMGSRPPWWLLNGVRPEGPEKNMGSYTVLTFSKVQQDNFGVGETGEVVDAGRFSSALMALREGTLMPGVFRIIERQPKIAPLRGLSSNDWGEDMEEPETPTGYTQ